MQPIQKHSSPRDAPVERRFSPRVRVTYRVELKSGSDRIVGHTTDVSGWGLFVETRRTLEIGSRVRLSFAVGASAHDIVEAHGVVARRVTLEDTRTSGQTPGLGIEIERFLWGRDRYFQAYDRLLAPTQLSAGPTLIRGRRDGRRASVGLPIYWGDGTGSVDRAGFITNLSRSGAFFVEAPPVPPGTRLHLWFEVPFGGFSRRVKAVATVVRVVGEDLGDGEAGTRGMGVRLETSTLDSKILEEFLDDRLDDAERRAGIRRHRETFGTDIDDLVLEALEGLETEPPDARRSPEIDRRERRGLRPGETRYRLVEIDSEPRVVHWGRVGSIAFKASVVMALGFIGLTLFQIMALL